MKKLLPLTLLIITFSCNQSDKYFLTFEDGGSIMERAPVFINGYKVGEIEKIKLTNNYKVLVIVKVKEEVSIPIDSEIIIESGFLGNSSIKITPGKSNTFYTSGDSINVNVNTTRNSPGIENIITSLIKNFVVSKDSLKQRTQDSILIELRKLNENLEKMQK
jgi:ABC-type transporter Mla subunit MlaD